MKLLLFGKNGQLGWELHRSLQGLGQVWAYDYPEVDFRAPSSLKRLVEDIAPQMVINAAAYTDVDKAESEPDIARLINTEAPGLLAETCRDLGIAFIHFSTDYVFNGLKGTPYNEDDPPHPLNVYGQTKFEGEREILEGGGMNLIFRTAWVYSLRRDSFVTKVLHWAHSQREMRIVEDQVSNPTWARALAEITSQLLAKAGPLPFSWLAELRGLYHLAGRGFTSRYEWARAILQNDPNVAEHLGRTIIRARSTDFPTPAVRPGFSALDCGRFERTFALRLPNWEESLSRAMRAG
jgi:dTDP-4-dehydrorhamnose reductase